MKNIDTKQFFLQHKLLPHLQAILVVLCVLAIPTALQAEAVKATAEGNCHIIDFNQDAVGLTEATTTNAGDVGLLGRRRMADGTIALGNHAAIFNSGMPTGDDTDLYTDDWGHVLVINQDRTNVPNDNQWGGILELDFSAFGPVTMYSLKALDIDEYEDWSWVVLYDGAGNELHRVQLQPLGDNSKQMVDLGGISGVMMMRVYLDGTGEDFVGSGAIDDIMFCVEEPEPNPACHIIDFNQEATGLIEATTTNAGEIGLLGRSRTSDGSMALGNHAAIFNSGMPTGDDDDLHTMDWGNVLIINRDRTGEPNDNEYGGVLEIDFSAVGSVTLYSLKALDIDEYEDWSWVKLYDGNGNELYSVQLQALGDNSKQMVDLGGTSGVVLMKVYLDGAGENFVGSGAIDDIMFCVDEPEPVCHIVDFNQDAVGLTEATATNAGDVGLLGRRRMADGTIALGNHAAIFNSGMPTGDDTDLYTDDWGHVLVINQDRTNVPNDNQWGGILELDFSAFGPVTMYSLKALDIDEYEDWSWVVLYDGAGNELHRVQLQPLGNNSKQMVDLGGISGVMMMRVYLDGTGEDFVGSGAIDDIMFCVGGNSASATTAMQAKATVSEIKGGTTAGIEATAYPMPFTGKTTLEFKVAEGQDYVVQLYDSKGQLVRELKAGNAKAGELVSVEIDGARLSDGLYFANIVGKSGIRKSVKLIHRK